MVVLLFHPRRCSLPHKFFEGQAEGAVARESAALCQLLCGKFLRFVYIFAEEPDKMLYAQSVDVDVVGDALLCKVRAKIGAVGADGHRKMRK